MPPPFKRFFYILISGLAKTLKTKYLVHTHLCFMNNSFISPISPFPKSYKNRMSLFVGPPENFRKLYSADPHLRCAWYLRRCRFKFHRAYFFAASIWRAKGSIQGCLHPSSSPRLRGDGGGPRRLHHFVRHPAKEQRNGPRESFRCVLV
jgi:hypothetical protein